MFIEFCVCTFFCHSFSPQVDSDLTAVAALGAAGKLLNACLSNSSLLTAYSLQQSLNFTNIITVPTLPSLGAQFDFGAVANFSASVRALGAFSSQSLRRQMLAIFSIIISSGHCTTTNK